MVRSPPAKYVLEQSDWKKSRGTLGCTPLKREANGTVVQRFHRGENSQRTGICTLVFLNIVKGEGDISRRERGTI